MFPILAATLGSDPATGATGYLLKDHLGSTRGLYSATKSPLAHLEYTPYGELYTNLGITTQANITPTFTGKPYDHETRLYYFPYRYYNPNIARWISRDPLGMIDGPNLYGYAKKDPISYYDPHGLACEMYEMTWTDQNGNEHYELSECVPVPCDCEDRCFKGAKLLKKACRKIPDKAAKGICKNKVKDWLQTCLQDCAVDSE